MASVTDGKKIRRGRRTLEEQELKTNALSNQRLLRALEIGGLAYIIIAVALSTVYATKEMTVGILVGGFIALVNFRAMEWFCKGLIKQGDSSKSFVKVTLKGGFILLAIVVALWFFKISPLGLTIGISAIVAAVLSYAGWLVIEQFVLERKQ